MGTSSRDTTGRTPRSVDCPGCGRNVLVRADGRLWKHAAAIDLPRLAHCRFSGAQAKDITPTTREAA